MYNSNLKPKVDAFASAHGLQVLEPLGSGIDGNVWKVMSKQKHFAWAVKLHREKLAYERERDCYERLAELTVSEVLDCAVPQLIRSHDEVRLIEMTIVERPFVLDFAGAYLDFPPDFSAEIWEEREMAWLEMYGDNLPFVLALKDQFERMGIYLTDLHPNNISPPGLQ